MFTFINFIIKPKLKTMKFTETKLKSKFSSSKFRESNFLAEKFSKRTFNYRSLKIKGTMKAGATTLTSIRSYNKICKTFEINMAISSTSVIK